MLPSASMKRNSSSTSVPRPRSIVSAYSTVGVSISWKPASSKVPTSAVVSDRRAAAAPGSQSPKPPGLERASLDVMADSVRTALLRPSCDGSEERVILRGGADGDAQEAAAAVVEAAHQDAGSAKHLRRLVGRPGGGYGAAVDGVGLAHGAQVGDEVRRADRVADAKSGQRVGLGEGAQHEPLWVVRKQRDARPRGEVGVRLVDHDHARGAVESG